MGHGILLTEHTCWNTLPRLSHSSAFFVENTEIYIYVSFLSGKVKCSLSVSGSKILTLNVERIYFRTIFKRNIHRDTVPNEPKPP